MSRLVAVRFFGAVVASLLAVGCGGSSGGGTAMLTISSGSLPNGATGVAYSATLSASGGVEPVSWTETGALPPGLSLDTSGTLAGTPTNAGTYAFTVTAVDSSDPALIASLAVSIVVTDSTVIVSTAPPPAGTLTYPYTGYGFAVASGGSPPFTWAVTKGTLPPGLTVGSDGSLTGTPTATGSFSFTVTATDSAPTPGTGSQQFTIKINTPGPLVISATPPPPAAVADSGYSYRFTTTSPTGGYQPLKWAVTAGALPPRLTLATNGQLSGTPTTIGSYSFTVTVTDSAPTPEMNSASFTIQITTPPPPAAFNPSTGNGFVSGPYLYTGISSSGASSGPDVFDGVGGYSGSYVLNTSGVISSGSISGPYTAAVGRAMTLGAYSGEVSADGNTILFANLQAGTVPYVEVDIKQGQTNFTNADFSGIYQVVSITSPGDSSSSLTLTADGAGGYSGNLVQNNAGVITSSAVSGTYSVAADGSLTITPASGSPLSGGISADGRTLVLSQLTAGQPSAFAAGIKQGQTNFTNADVVGTYNIVNYTGNSAELATLDFDGAGNINGTTTTNDAGTIANSSVTGTYAVVADGTLTVTILHPYVHPLWVTFTGGVSSDGNTLVLIYANLPTGFSSAASVGVRL